MQPVFRYDFNSPYAYLAAVRVDEVLGSDTAWQPIAFAFVLSHHRRPYSRAAFARNFVAGTGLRGEAPLEAASRATARPAR